MKNTVKINFVKLVTVFITKYQFKNSCINKILNHIFLRCNDVLSISLLLLIKDIILVN